MNLRITPKFNTQFSSQLQQARANHSPAQHSKQNVAFGMNVEIDLNGIRKLLADNKVPSNMQVDIVRQCIAAKNTITDTLVRTSFKEAIEDKIGRIKGTLSHSEEASAKVIKKGDLAVEKIFPDWDTSTIKLSLIGHDRLGALLLKPKVELANVAMWDGNNEHNFYINHTISPQIFNDGIKFIAKEAVQSEKNPKIEAILRRMQQVEDELNTAELDALCGQ